MKPVLFNRALSAFAVLAFLAALENVLADNFTWTNIDANLIWDTSSGNWDSGCGNIPWADDNVAIFGATGPGTITVSGTRVITGRTTTAVGYALTVAGNGTAVAYSLGNGYPKLFAQLKAVVAA